VSLVYWDHALEAWVPMNGAPAAPSGYPDETNTGIAGLGLELADLTPYTGFGSFDAEVSYNQTAFLAANMTNGYVRIDEGGDFTATGCYFDRRIDCDGTGRTLTLIDCTVDASGGFVGVGFSNVILIRCNVFNANNCVNIARNLVMEDSYIHHPFLPPGSADHINPVFFGGAEDSQIVIRRNTLWAPIPDNEFGGGVSTSLSLFPDFGPVYDVLIEDNFIRWTYGAYAVSLGWNPGKDFNDHELNATQIRVLNNIFERGPSGFCGALAPVTSWRHDGDGNEFAGNAYDDGTPIDPA
jgi:hypothetical protein